MADQHHEKDVGAQSPIYHNTPRDEPMTAKRYITTRLSTLKPPMAKAPNPIRLLRMLNTQQWLFFLVAFFAWTWLASRRVVSDPSTD